MTNKKYLEKKKQKNFHELLIEISLLSILYSFFFKF